ncbi:MAG: PqqD family protein [Gemmobacter sp.]
MTGRGRKHRSDRTGGRHDLPPEPVRWLRWPGIGDALSVRRADPVIDSLGRITRGWQPEPAEATSTPLSKLSGRRDGYRVDSRWLDAPLDALTATAAACALIADLSQAYAADRPDHLCLHTGAVGFAGRLIALTGAARAGKSTLVARLSAEADMTIFCDDVLPVDPDGRGIALGFAPRLRLPVPDASTAAHRRHVATHQSLEDGRYGYLMTPTLAPHGTRSPLTVILQLARGAAGAPAGLQALSGAETLKLIRDQDMSAPDEAAEIPDYLGRLSALAAQVAGYRLLYDDIEDAVALIRRSFGGAGLPDIAPPDALPEPDGVSASGPLQPADIAQVWSRMPGVTVRRIGGQACLWGIDGGGVFVLNALAAAIWQALEHPVSGLDLADALAEAFPDAAPEQIALDLGQLFAHLEAEGLVRAPPWP